MRKQLKWLLDLFASGGTNAIIKEEEICGCLCHDPESDLGGWTNERECKSCNGTGRVKK